ncbi:hypothetical protein STAS_08954, partial [Striga asiatica]
MHGWFWLVHKFKWLRPSGLFVNCDEPTSGSKQCTYVKYPIINHHRTCETGVSTTVPSTNYERLGRQQEAHKTYKMHTREKHRDNIRQAHSSCKTRHLKTNPRSEKSPTPVKHTRPRVLRSRRLLIRCGRVLGAARPIFVIHRKLHLGQGHCKLLHAFHRLHITTTTTLGIIQPVFTNFLLGFLLRAQNRLLRGLLIRLRTHLSRSRSRSRSRRVGLQLTPSRQALPRLGAAYLNVFLHHLVILVRNLRVRELHPVELVHKGRDRLVFRDNQNWCSNRDHVRLESGIDRWTRVRTPSGASTLPEGGSRKGEPGQNRAVDPPYFALEGGVGGSDRKAEALIEDGVVTAAVDDFGGDGVFWVAREAELGVHVLLLVDADVVDVAGMVDVHVEGRQLAVVLVLVGPNVFALEIDLHILSGRMGLEWGHDRLRGIHE